jgi:hypothetical protein
MGCKAQRYTNAVPVLIKIRLLIFTQGSAMKQIRARLSHWVGVAAVALLLSACGGGGGGDAAAGGGLGGSASVASAPVGTPTTVQGTVTYKRFDHAATTAALDYTNELTKPVRGATVQLLFGATVVATTTTSANGTYSFSAVPGSSTYVIRVRAELKQASGAATWDVTVRDNTASGEPLYALQSGNFIPASNPTQNLTAASGWTGGAMGSYTGTRVAAPFAILDTLYESQQKVLAANANTNFPLLKAFWSVNNSTSAGTPANGGIGASYFTEVLSGTTVTERRLYILGLANNDTDEYDASVVAHEWGHYYQSALSRDDSTGGRHSIDVSGTAGGDDLLDRRIAFSEGWGNAWSGVSLGRTFYADAEGANQASGFRINLNTTYPTTDTAQNPRGLFRERSIQYILWDLSRQAGFTGVHQALTSSAFKTGTALSDIHSFSSAYRTVAGATSTATAALDALLLAESISISDAFGNNETSNTAGIPASVPYYRTLSNLTTSPATVANGNSICTNAGYTSADQSVQDRNRHGYFAYVKFNVTGNVTSITVTGDNVFNSAGTLGVDTDFQLYKAGQLLADAKSAGFNGLARVEKLTQNLTAGEYVLVIFDYNKIYPSVAPNNVCYTVAIQ